MKKLFTFALVFALTFGLAGCKNQKAEPAPADAVQTEKAVDSAQEHLDKANQAMEELKTLLEKNKPGAWLMDLLAPAALAQEDTDAQVEALINTILDETQAAAESAAAAGDATQVAETLDAVSQLQDEQVDVLNEALDVTESEDASVTITAALEEVVDSQAQVDTALEAADTAAQSGAETVAVTLTRPQNRAARRAEIKARAEARAKEALTGAQSTLDELIAAGATDQELADAKAKLARIQSALEQGKFGRATGLGRAVMARARHIKARAGKLEKRVGNAEAFLSGSADRLAELVAAGATAEEVAAFEGRIAKVQRALESGAGNLENLREVAKEVRANVKERREALKEKREALSDLSDEQKEALKERAEAKREELKTKYEEKKVMREEKRAEFEKAQDVRIEERRTKVDSVKEVIREKQDARIEERREKVDARIEEKGVTPPPQLQEKREARDAKVEERREVQDERVDERREQRDDKLQERRDKR